MRTAAEFLEAAAGEFKAKNAIYGDNYLNVGKAMTAFFPEGIEVKTADDWNRLHIFLLQIVKLTRYCNNWMAIEEKAVFARSDSMHDNTVYSAMLESIDAMIAEALKLSPAPVKSPLPPPLPETDDHFRKRVLAAAPVEMHSTIAISGGAKLDRHGGRYGLARRNSVKKIPCDYCNTHSICEQEQHCDMVGNGYR